MFLLYLLHILKVTGKKSYSKLYLFSFPFLPTVFQVHSFIL